jgi:hypothetical protein
MCGHIIISLFDIDGENRKIKMEKITLIILFFLHPTYKNKFEYFNFSNKAYYFVNFFIYQFFYALRFS